MLTSSLVTVVTSRVSAETLLPVKVSVNDMWGAITFGFIAYFLGGKFVQWLIDLRNKNSGQGGNQGKPPDPKTSDPKPADPNLAEQEATAKAAAEKKVAAEKAAIEKSAADKAAAEKAAAEAAPGAVVQPPEQENGNG